MNKLSDRFTTQRTGVDL